MRLLKLDLRAFGSFSGVPAIDFRDDRGLHLVVGPNEAGKSTALRAIRRLLFGFPLQAGDDHLHKYDNMRIGAVIRSEDGRERPFARRKNGARKLWEFDDSGPIDDQALSPYLAGMDEARFIDLFSMDHAELVDGGRTILKGGGRIGEMLFAAGTGLAGIDRVRKSLQDEMDRLFKPTGKNPTINEAIKKLEDAKAEAQGSMLDTSAWVELNARLAREEASKKAIDREIQDIEGEKRRLERLRDALPVFSQRGFVLGRLDELGGRPVLADDFAQRRSEADLERLVGIQARLDAETALDAAEKTLAGFGPPPAVLGEADAIGRARDALGDYRKALKEHPAEQDRLAQKRREARDLLDELPPGLRPEEADRLRLPAGLKEQVQALDKDLTGLDAGHSAAEGELAKLATGPETFAPAPRPGAARLAETLAAEIARVQSMGDLEAQLANDRLKLVKAEQQAEVELHGLPLWSGTLDELEAMKVPPDETLNRFAAGFQAADQKLDRARDDLATAEAERAGLDREIEREQLNGSVPTEAELAERRARRDDGWRTIRRGWIDGAPVENPSAVAEGFEAAVRSADDIADRLRREANAVAERAEREMRRRKLVDEIDSLIDDRDRADRERVAIGHAWADLWRRIGLEPLPPAEMKEWATIRRADLIRQAKDLRDRRADIADRAIKVEETKADLARHLADLGEAVAGPAGSLAGLLDRSKAAVERVRLTIQIEVARARLAKAEAARDAWKVRWASAVRPLGLLVDASPAQAVAVINRFESLATVLREAAEARARIDEHARVAGRFEADVRSLVARVAPELSDTPIEEAAQDLSRRLNKANVVEGQRDVVLKTRDTERAKLEKARAEVNRAELKLAALVSEAGCGPADDLNGAINASDEIKRLKKELHGYDMQLAVMAGTATPEGLREQAEGADSDAILAEIAGLTDRLALRKAERDRSVEEIVRCRENLKRMDGGPAAAEAQQAVEEQGARLAIDVERYARLRLASAVLRDAVERYRKNNAGPVVKRAGELFTSLTTGSFVGLRTDFDDKGQSILLGVRADGAPLKVDGMSEGTADQLYLALRLASLEIHLQNHEPMPLVVDDILVNFDNARALAALKALAELSKRTQVLFFTHHEHLRDLAASALGEDVLQVHRLDHPPVSVGVNGHAPAEEAKPRRKGKKPAPAADEG